MLGKTTNKLLQNAEQAILAKVPPNLQNAVQRIVTAGEKVMYDPQTRHLMVEEMGKPGDPAEIAGEGAAKLLGLLYKQSKNTMPIKAGIPAATILLCEGLDFMEKAGKVQITNDVIAAATKALAGYVLQMFGVSQDKMHQYMNAGIQSQQKGAPAPAQPSAQPTGIISTAQQGA